MKLVLLLTVAVLSGCANPNLVGLRGDKLDTRYGLQDRRAAKMHIKLFEEQVPPGNTSTRTYQVERCNQYAQDEKPSKQTLTDDLIMLAYAEGADAVSDIKFYSESAILKNCWTVERASGMFWISGPSPR